MYFLRRHLQHFQRSFARVIQQPITTDWSILSASRTAVHGGAQLTMPWSGYDITGFSSWVLSSSQQLETRPTQGRSSELVAVLLLVLMAVPGGMAIMEKIPRLGGRERPWYVFLPFILHPSFFPLPPSVPCASPFSLVGSQPNIVKMGFDTVLTKTSCVFLAK